VDLAKIKELRRRWAAKIFQDLFTFLAQNGVRTKVPGVGGNS